MQYTFTILLLLSLSTGALTQSLTVGFEEFSVPLDSFIVEAPGGVFDSPPLVLPNDYNADFNSFNGWVLSTKTDVTTPGFGNQFSAITGQGAENSLTYAVGYPPFEQPIIIRRDSDGVDRTFRDLLVTNTTYSYFSMLDGDMFASKFGGVSGDEPDFFSIVIKAYEGGALLPDSVEFFLADYRFTDNSLDYIVDEWTLVNLSNTFPNPVDSLGITFRSSDTGDFGINTPTYLAIDNVRMEPFTNTARPTLLPAPSVYPNPVRNHLTITEMVAGTPLQVLDVYGRVMQRQIVRSSTETISTASLPAGVYWIQTPNREAVRIVKH